MPLTTSARAGLVTVGLGAATLAYAGLVERRWYALRRDVLPVLRHGGRPLRILHVADLHLVPGQDHRLEFARRCLETDPDLVVSTGDSLEDEGAIDSVVELHAALAKDRPGVAVLGAHDFWGPTFRNPASYLFGASRRVHGRRLSTGRLVDGLTEAGFEVLQNRRITIDTVAGPVDVAGLGDPHVKHDRPERIDWSQPVAPMALRLGLVHAPYRRSLDLFDRHGFDLVLAGHTHGGQVRLPGFGALVANCDLPLRQARGTSRHGTDLWLHVSAGLGHSRYAPVRFACRPEASVLDLVTPIEP